MGGRGEGGAYDMPGTAHPLEYDMPHAAVLGPMPFQIGELLGVGGFGKVYRATHVETKQEVAIKMMLPNQDAQRVAQEVEVLRSCRSDFVVAYHGSCLTDGMLWIIMECCEGSLHDVMEATGKCLTERQISACCAASLDGLLFLHRRQIMHRALPALGPGTSGCPSHSSALIPGV